MPAGDYRAAVLFLPKSRELADYLLQALAARLAGKPLYLVGEKRGGIERAAKQLAVFGNPRKLDSARHCQLWCATVEQVPQQPDLQALAQRYPLQLSDGTLEIVTLPGVFAHGRLDRGSALLLEHLQDLPSGHLLDFGGVPAHRPGLEQRPPGAGRATALARLSLQEFVRRSSARQRRLHPDGAGHSPRHAGPAGGHRGVHRRGLQGGDLEHADRHHPETGTGLPAQRQGTEHLGHGVLDPEPGQRNPGNLHHVRHGKLPLPTGPADPLLRRKSPPLRRPAACHARRSSPVSAWPGPARTAASPWEWPPAATRYGYWTTGACS
ncbi:UNVERIFIED_CONTAM: rsmC [Trichonephila clavipes]